MHRWLRDLVVPRRWRTVDEGPTWQPVRDHYIARWGEPEESFHPVRSGNQSGFPGEVVAWPEDLTADLGVKIYATVGASTFVSGDGHASEFVCGVASDCPGIADGLADLSTVVVRNGLGVGHGSTFAFAKPLWRGTRMTAMLCLQQEGTIDTLVGPGWHVEFYQAMPVFTYEVAIKRRDGVSGLLAWWQENETRFWDPHRTPTSG
ncbi:hypothetical protein GCM10009557_84400 [Virgisporangium ochraceum]|uniref:Suppressor of fused-like domain-containing protein n=1 Tax=Virgisporangium ochraceum TaxID=65505 RepID=A0A8J4A7V8_9ACTN|nr:suppressor of fused domain protein [Virgisporangium ochraceum]GIJ75510.1 hypothetical protein Voc01_104270 [Virgisporangium ochraceum]